MANTTTSAVMGSLYRTIWRWHFFAGLLVLPFLVMMAVTGGAYHFKPELDHWVYRSMEDVPARTQAFVPASVVVDRVVLRRVHDRVVLRDRVVTRALIERERQHPDLGRALQLVDI